MSENAERPGGGLGRLAREIWQTIYDVVVTALWAVALALVIRTFAFEPFRIPSGSMLPGLWVGDYLFVSKYSYGYSRYAFPFGASTSPWNPFQFEGRLLPGAPERGDVAVFRQPINPKIDYIKRVIGLPGDRIQMIEGLLHINGEPIKRERIEDFIENEEGGRTTRVKRWRETLPNGVSYTTLDLIDNGFYDNTQDYVVPAGHYFMMGDNRDDSTDSRTLAAVGYVPAQNLIGRAEFLFFSTDGSAEIWEVWKWPFAIRYGRLLMGVR